MALESTLELPDEMEDSLEASGRLPDNNAVQMLWWKSHYSDILMLGKSNVHDNSLFFGLLPCLWRLEGLAVFHAEKKGSSNATRRSNATRNTQSGISRLFVVS
jgi:hypothetical protein